MTDANYKRAKRNFTATRAEHVSQLAEEIGAILKLTGARVEAAACKGKNKGTLDYSLEFAGGSIFLCNLESKLIKDKTTSAVIKALDSIKRRYQKLLKSGKKLLKALKERERKDNERAAGMGLKPYTLKRVGITTAGLYSGWAYLVLDIGGKERLHIETSLNDAIMNLNVAEISRILDDYSPAGDYEDAKVDFIAGGIGFIFSDRQYTASQEGVTLIAA